MYHPQVSRRVAIQAGSVGLLGLGMNHLEPLQAMASEVTGIAYGKKCDLYFPFGRLSSITKVLILSRMPRKMCVVNLSLFKRKLRV